MQLRFALGVASVLLASWPLGCSSSSDSSSSTAGQGGGTAGQAGTGASTAGAGGTSGGSGSSGVAAGPNLDSNLKLNTLTADQKGVLCDWYMPELGGYGASFACGGGVSQTNYADKATCVAELKFLCSGATVGALTSCAIAQAPSHGCDMPSPACNPLYCLQ